MNKPQSALELLQSLVRIPSVNPQGNPGCDKTGEQACAEYIAEFLKECGAKVQLEEVMPGRPNVVGVWPSDKPGKPRLVFGPHTDTVSVAGMTIPPFDAEVREGKIWGRGSSDTKGPMASMLWALHECREQLPHLSHEIVFAGFMGEEAGQHGAKAFLAKHGESLRVLGSLVMAGEPTGLNAVVAHKGALWLSITTRGNAAHAAEPERGSNAIYKMADIIRALADDIGPALAFGRHPLLGHTTLSVGTINGGNKVNIVPDTCHIEVDIRFLPDDDKLMDRLKRWLTSVCKDVEIEHSISMPMHTEETHPMIGALKECGSQVIGAPWFSDAAIFAHAGIPAIAIGPGSIAQAHTKDEWLDLDELERGVNFFSGLIGKLEAQPILV